MYVFVCVRADPSDEEKLAMSKVTKIGMTQISHWYVTYNFGNWLLTWLLSFLFGILCLTCVFSRFFLWHLRRGVGLSTIVREFGSLACLRITPCIAGITIRSHERSVSEMY